MSIPEMVTNVSLLPRDIRESRVTYVPVVINAPWGEGAM